MQTYNLYILLKRNICSGLFLSILFLQLSCTQNEENFPKIPVNHDWCKATLHLNTSAFGQTDKYGTRSYVAGNSDENRINDIWVFQYNAETGESLKDPVYLEVGEFDSNNIEVDLKRDELSLICIVANTNEGGWALDDNKMIKEEFNTFDKLKELPLPRKVSDAFVAGNMGESGRTIPMFGVSKAMVIGPKYYVSVPLVRMFTRVQVSVDPSYLQDLGMTIERIKLSNIPFYCRVETLAPSEGDAQAGEYPLGINWPAYTAPEKVNEVTLYIPENLQGKVTGMTSKQEATEGFPEKALRTELTMSYGENDTIVYTIYPGLDMINDFNIKRNYIYNVSINITKLPE